ncbi:site-specific DNA-methyltransferase [Xanthomonas citri pv. malvacearum]|uniref:site-specific DNA-methyltransferase (adenine-specific) n=1 Tax=Xanthomonas campestris pv. malvacearum TaxID=86040 RepID=A0AA44Z0R4_XANCM|nr:site-specific DNA-methyltransferase [Xanthomonas citri]AOL20427.1 DNA methylase N-4 [Xanthomonas citri pv. malvacearum]ASN02339.1 DNA methylase N-4 [Xanthomonas citri pv. malvacearum]ASN08566.1 DNA methylase N-4 [Xanthomonas citri pv. malvacearum]ASY85514.1 site-specific DNA-methyltransferase [Xanthomonas citri pv. malvacearum]ASY89710.1 site-specific DNA-methyltransferase [Xanthomonas citri pv. malvacearum]
MNKQKLELTWIGKEKRPKLEPRILLEDPDKSYHAKHRVSNSDIFENRLIFGDNLLALKALENEFTGQVKCVFIDPPYNTGSAFTHYDDGLEHSIWLGLMRDRLEIIRRLLSEDGSLWITIDDNEAHYLKVLCDEIFGRSNFVASMVWEKDSGRKNDTDVSSSHDYVLLFARNRGVWRKTRNMLDRSEDQLKRYQNPDNDPRGPWRQGADGTAKSGGESLLYPITLPSGRVVTPPSGNFWRFSRATFEIALAEGRVYFGKDGNRLPVIKKYITDIQEGVVPKTWWPAEEVGSNQEARRDHLRKLLPDIEPFATPKPERLIRRVLEIATNPGDLILDSFAGSGTSGAVAHKMGRRWIMVELGEHCHTHIIPRLKKVIDGEDKGGVTESTAWQGGGGFRYHRLAPSLIIDDRWGNKVINPEYNAAQLAEALAKLEGFAYAPSETYWWQQGHSSERDFIYVTTQNLSAQQLQALSDEVGPERSLLVCCAAFHGVTAAKAAERWPTLTLKKIPKMVLTRCHWGHDDYSLNVANLPMAEIEKAEPAALGNSAKSTKSRKAALVNAGQGGLFGEKK